jgi:hypothetical protein
MSRSRSLPRRLDGQTPQAGCQRSVAGWVILIGRRRIIGRRCGGSAARHRRHTGADRDTAPGGSAARLPTAAFTTALTPITSRPASSKPPTIAPTKPFNKCLSAVARQGGSRALGRGEAAHGRDPGLPRSFAKILAILALAALCFIAGLIVRTGPACGPKMPLRRGCWKSFPAIRCCGASPDASPVRRTDPALRRRSPRSKRHWSGSDCRETGGRLLYCAGSVCADADGRSDLHPAARTGSSGHVPFTAALKMFLK